MGLPYALIVHPDDADGVIERLGKNDKIARRVGTVSTAKDSDNPRMKITGFGHEQTGELDMTLEDATA